MTEASTTSTSTLAIVGTLRELHAVLPDYDLRRLADLIATRKPDLLCVEVDRQDWEANRLDQAPVESREALVAVTRSSEITLVPIGGGGPTWVASGIAPPRQGLFGTLRGRLFRALDQMTVGLMRRAGGPRAVNSRWVEHLCATLCMLQVSLTDPASRRAWETKNRELLDGVLWIVRRDPGRRILVALDCRRKHWLGRQLRSAPDVRLVDYWRF
jgi:hypothetical protein